jgi:ComF family protein
MPFGTFEGIDHPCGDCIEKHPPFEAARGAFLYEGVIRDLIHRLKYDERVQCRRPLGLLMAERLAVFAAETSPHMIIPVPLHLKRLRQRGFNQAILLGEVLSREWQVPLERRLLRRIRWTEPQVNLKAEERAANVRGAFEVSRPESVRGKTVMLVDDVLTTGSTVKECSRVLKTAGVGSVLVATVARVAPAQG